MSPGLARAAAVSWRVLVIVTAGALVLYLLIQLRLVVLPVILALFLSTLLVPPANLLRRRGLPPSAATAAVVVGAVLLLAGVVLLLVTQVTPQLSTLGQQVTRGIEDVQRWLATGPLHVSEEELSGTFDRLRASFGGDGRGVARGLLTGATVAGEIAAGLILTLVLTFFFVKDGDRFSGFLLDVVGEQRREDARAIGRQAWETVSAYLRGVATVGLVDAVLIGIGLVIVGVPLVIPLAVLTFFGAFFPLVGAFLAGALAALVALVAKGPLAALIVIGITIGVQQLEGHVLAPVVLGRAVNLHPVAILLALTAGAVLAGIVGAFLAVPVMAVAWTVLVYLRQRGQEEVGEAERRTEEVVTPPSEEASDRVP
ncbi:MAG TPA: AI-2E family transporter [Actinomycetota bacterium]|nr:AI-2E family transporter [Actinomycetota bacterium]